ncbi:MAG: hypothetical protein ACYC91_13425 [Solirubrobacteraceae bacterium]
MADGCSAAGGGRGRALKCPYHSWAYDLNGELLGQPLARDAFVELAGLDPDLGDWDSTPGILRGAQRSLSGELKADPRHVPGELSRVLAAPQHAGPDMLSTPFMGEQFSPHACGAAMGKEVVKLLEQPESEWRLRPFSSVVYLLFPSVVINLPMSGHAELWQMYHATTKVVFEEDFDRKRISNARCAAA